MQLVPVGSKKMPGYFETDRDTWSVRVANGQFLGYLEATEEMLGLLKKLQSKNIDDFKAEISSIVSERSEFLNYAYENVP